MRRVGDAAYIQRLLHAGVGPVTDRARLWSYG
jgi:hypothetical protein